MSTSDLHSVIYHLLKNAPLPGGYSRSRQTAGERDALRLMIKKILYDTLTFFILAAVLIALAYLAIGGVYSAISGQTFEQSLSAMWTFLTKRR